MEFFSYHGCFKEEQIIGTRFMIDLELEVQAGEAEISDHLHDTLNYTAVYQLVKREMEQKSYLLEHVARRILDGLQSEFRQIEQIEIKISKINPPVGGKMQQVSYMTSWKK